MNDYFVDPTGQGGRSIQYDSDKAISPTKDNTSFRGMSHSLLQPAEFDSFKYGFELPASQQLSRVNAKIGRWDRAQQLISVSKMGEEQRTKKIEDR